MPTQQTMTASPLLTFAEAAKELGVDLEKLRRLVVEDRAIGVVSVDRGGNRKTIDLEGLLGGGHWRVDEGGKLCVATGEYEQHLRVGTSYVPLDVGELRIEREQLIEYIQRTPPVEVIGGPDAADASPTPASIFGKPNLPMGLDPETIASVFAGIYRSKLEWRETLKKPGKWLTAPGVVMRRGARGKGPDGQMRPTLVDGGIDAHLFGGAIRR
jgi:hypothetical protein